MDPGALAEGCADGALGGRGLPWHSPDLLGQMAPSTQRLSHILGLDQGRGAAQLGQNHEAGKEQQRRTPGKGGQGRSSSATAAAGGGEPGRPEPCPPRQGRRLRKAGRPKGRAQGRAGAVRPGHPGELTGRVRGTLRRGGRVAPGARGPEGRP